MRKSEEGTNRDSILFPERTQFAETDMGQRHILKHVDNNIGREWRGKIESAFLQELSTHYGEPPKGASIVSMSSNEQGVARSGVCS